MKYSILTVDDDEMNLFVMEKMITLEGHDSISVDAGQKALELLRVNVFDLIFMDINMPHMDGFETTARIRSGDAGEDRKDIPIFAYTAYASRIHRNLFYKACFDGYVFKPFGFTELGAFIRLFTEHNNDRGVNEDKEYKNYGIFFKRKDFSL